ncbi:endosome-associated-trafficking regulator 1 isoform X4 [Phycodurus eques]|uniref:endosome-associated-trafficking regulator 1 isoform X4 n=1 Tax=Phycodurus eques TaxID=693459 RepID=UPI002ACDE798|nr:endosome-associated-trafficking regulator 1 isoform X4 [Phycodurus eques]
MATRGSRGKTLIFSEDGEELNPFSFREFLRTKDRNRNRKRTRTRTCQCGGCVRIETRLRFYRGDDDVTQPIGSRGRSLQELHEENVSLTRAISALRRTSEANGRRAEALEEELQRGRQREEEEARDLEDTVRSVERNLREMTDLEDGTMNSAVYRGIRKENVRPSLRDLKLKPTWVLQQDNDPIRTSKSTSEWLKKNKMKTLDS